SRGGGLIRVYDPITPQIWPLYASPYGTQWSPGDNTGDVSCVWALEVTAGSGAWARWSPFAGWWPTNAAAGNPLRYVTGITYTYHLIQMDVNGAEHVSNSVDVTIDAPKDFSIEQNYPNPFTPVTGSTDFSYTVPADGEASVVIYNQLGEVVRTFVNGLVGTG